MKTRSHFLPKLIIVLWISFRLSGATGQPSGYDQKAKEILDAANVKGGLIVHIGCGDGRLTAALRGGDSCLVQGLDTDADTIRGAREYIRKLGIYGPVSVEQFDGKLLPYADNLVNLVVAEDIGGVTTADCIYRWKTAGYCVWRDSSRGRRPAVAAIEHFCICRA